MNPSFSSPITPPPHRPLPQPPLPCIDHSRSPPLLQYEQPLSLTSGYYDIPSTVTKTPPEKNRNTLFAPDPPLKDYPREVTWLFFRDNKWTPFQSENHHKIEQAFTMGGIYVDIKDHNFPQLKSIRVFPARFYLSYLGMKYRLSCVIQG